MKETGMTNLRTVVFTCCLMLCLSSIANASISYFDLGTAAPPSSIGGISMTPFPLDARSLTTFSSVPVPSPLSGNIAFSIPLQHLRVTQGWATWSHGYLGDVYWTQGPQTVTLTMPNNTQAFYLYDVPNSFEVFNITIITNGGLYRYTVEVIL